MPVSFALTFSAERWLRACVGGGGIGTTDRSVCTRREQCAQKIISVNPNSGCCCSKLSQTESMMREETDLPVTDSVRVANVSSKRFNCVQIPSHTRSEIRKSPQIVKNMTCKP